jgi:magnesium transporter
VKRRDLLRLPLAGTGRLTASLNTAPWATPGSTPGTTSSASAAGDPPPMYVMAYGPHEMTEAPVTDLDQIAAMRGHWPVLWLNVDGVRHPETLDRIAGIFQLHRLAIEDVGHVGQQAEMESFGDHLLIIAKMVRLCPALETEQVSIFVGSDYLITFQEHPGDSLDPVRERIRRSRGRIRGAGADYLAYTVVDAMVDHCFPIVEQYMERLDALQDEILTSPKRNDMALLHASRRDLLSLRRAVYPMREAVAAIVRDPPPELVREETLVYLRDVQDHAMQVVDLVESCRELAASLTDLYLSSVANRTNDIMKVLTIFAALFIPLGFITGLYGMNVMGPPLWLRDLRVAELSMLGIAAGLLFFFWRRGWLEGSR